MEDVQKNIDEIWKKLNEIESVVNKNRFDGAASVVESIRASDKSFATLDKTVRLIVERQKNSRERLKNVEETVEKLHTIYVTKVEYTVVRSIVITTAGLMLLGLITSILKLILPNADFPL